LLNEINTIDDTKTDEEKHKTIQIKVVMQLKYWFKNYKWDFLDEKNFNEAQKIVDSISKTSEKRGKDLDKALQDVHHIMLQKNYSPASYPEPKFPIQSDKANLDIFKIPVEEIARQLCLADFKIFEKIKPSEFMNEAWLKNKENAKNVTDLIKRFNIVTTWTQAAILYQKELHRRAEAIGRLLKIAGYLDKMNNLNSLAALHAGLVATPIIRLKKTFARLGSQAKKELDRLNELFQIVRNRTNLRKRTEKMSQPAIPHLALFLGDLTFISTGNKDTKDGKINFKKYSLLSERIQWIQMFQQSRYCFQEVPAIHNYFRETMQCETESLA